MPPNIKDNKSDPIKSLTKNNKTVDKIKIKEIFNIFFLRGIIDKFL